MTDPVRRSLAPLAAFFLSTGHPCAAAESQTGLGVVPLADMLPRFAQWQPLAPSPAPARAAAFAQFLRTTRPDVYGRGGHFDLDDPGLAATLAKISTLLPAMRATERAVLEEEAGVIKALVGLFPDFQPARVRISLILSLLQFDAKVPSDAPDQLWVGLDGIAQNHPPPFPLEVLLAHEGFHLYHFQVNPQPRGSVPLYRQVWQEGLACYVSRLVHPQASLAEVLLDPDLAAHGPKFVPTVAQAMLDDLRADDDVVTGRYLSQQGPFGALPARMGYLVGLQAVSRAAAAMPLAKLVRLRGEALAREMERQVGALARGGDSGRETP